MSWTGHTLPILANYSQLLDSLPILAALGALYLKHTCHTRYCFRLAWQADPESGHPLCKKHHPDDPKKIRPG